MGEFCTISVDHYRELVQAQTTLEIIIELEKNGKAFRIEDVLQAYLKEGEENECTD